MEEEQKKYSTLEKELQVAREEKKEFQKHYKELTQALSNENKIPLEEYEKLMKEFSNLKRFHEETTIDLTDTKRQKETLEQNFQNLVAKQEKSNGELERLRGHLIKVNEDNVIEALQAQDTIEKLQNNILKLSEQLELEKNKKIENSKSMELKGDSENEEQNENLKYYQELKNTLEQKIEQITSENEYKLGNLQSALEMFQAGNFFFSFYFKIELFQISTQNNKIK